ncbi:MAG: LacI family DNA-binding transcriptional regulator [Anaerolineae bacterium]|nr:LacI family DNA-binding transcriptional regulator [Anaerolineae bacterium]
MTPQSRVTIDDVAERAGVSIATVSRVVNNTGKVAAATAERVNAAVAELDYVPHAGARGLAGSRRNTIGLIFPGVGDDFLTELLFGIDQEFTDAGYELLLYSTRLRRRDGTILSLPLGEHNTDGLIIYAGSLEESEIKRLYERGFPVVLLHQSAPAGLAIPSVTFENKEGAKTAVSHLISLGRKRIVYLAGLEGNEDSHWRELGYREALAAHDIPFVPELVVTGGFNDVVAETAVAQLLQSGVAFDAIFAADDRSASGAFVALQQAGKRIPEDVAVIGFDDANFARFLTPPLTTIHAPIEESGRKAAEQVIRLIQGGAAEMLTLLPTELIVRESCGGG